MFATRLIAATVLLAGGNAAFPQNIGVPPPQNVVQLSATAAVDVRQDLLTLLLSTTREGSDPAAVQVQLKTALDAALAQARQQVEPGQLEVRTGNFALVPRYSKDGQISNWQGRAELVLEGRDFARIGAVAGRIQTLTVAHAGFSLSREQRARAEEQAQQMAVENFQQKSERIAKGFGFSGYSLREVSINANDQFPPPQLRMRSMAAASKMAADEPVPVEAGNSTVQVTVNGSVQLK